MGETTNKQDKAMENRLRCCKQTVMKPIIVHHHILKFSSCCLLGYGTQLKQKHESIAHTAFIYGLTGRGPGGCHDHPLSLWFPCLHLLPCTCSTLLHTAGTVLLGWRRELRGIMDNASKTFIPFHQAAPQLLTAQ